MNCRSTPQNLQILYQDNHIIVINKRASDIVQGDKTGDTPLSDIVKSYLKLKHNKPGNVFLGTVHRLDRPTSGIVVFSKTSKALSRLNKMFQNHEVEKTYWAITRKNNTIKPQDTLTHFLRKNAQQNKSYITPENIKGSKKAILHYQIIQQLEKYQVFEIQLETGRHHQIRCQLAAIECPIVGDLKYHYPRSNQDASICLHSRKIQFIHPVNKEKLMITAPLPENGLWKFIKP
ncbi:MAG: RluA family pseudouridine synthase [Flavobacteriales bacterium]